VAALLAATTEAWVQHAAQGASYDPHLTIERVGIGVYQVLILLPGDSDVQIKLMGWGPTLSGRGTLTHLAIDGCTIAERPASSSR
jgi:hypothetical protein